MSCITSPSLSLQSSGHDNLSMHWPQNGVLTAAVGQLSAVSPVLVISIIQLRISINHSKALVGSDRCDVAVTSNIWNRHCGQSACLRLAGFSTGLFFVAT